MNLNDAPPLELDPEELDPDEPDAEEELDAEDVQPDDPLDEDVDAEELDTAWTVEPALDELLVCDDELDAPVPEAVLLPQPIGSTAPRRASAETGIRWFMGEKLL